MAEASRKPVLRVVRGHPDDAELAALVTVLLARRGAGGEPDRPARHGWAAHWRALGVLPVAPAWEARTVAADAAAPARG
jgi:hypothetical protein